MLTEGDSVLRVCTTVSGGALEKSGLWKWYALTLTSYLEPAEHRCKRDLRVPLAGRRRKWAGLGRRDTPNVAPYALTGWGVASFPSSPSPQRSGSLYFGAWPGQGRALRLTEPLSPHGRTQSPQVRVSQCLPAERGAGCARVAAFQTSHSPPGPRLTLSRSICRDVLTEVGDLPTPPLPGVIL